MDSLHLKWDNFEVCHLFKGDLLLHNAFHTPLGEGHVITPEENVKLEHVVRDKAAQAGGWGVRRCALTHCLNEGLEGRGLCGHRATRFVLK